MRPTRVLLLLVVLALVAVPGRAQTAGSTAPPEVDVRAFIELVDRISTALDSADPQRLTGVLIAMPTRIRVRAGDQHFDVPFEPVAQMVAGAAADRAHWPERRQAIQQRLRMIRNEASSFEAAAAPGDGAGPHAALSTILAGEEFVRAAPAPWTTRVRARIVDWLRGLWERIGGNRLDTDRTARAVLWISTLAALGGLMLWLYRRLRRQPPAAPFEPLSPDAGRPARRWALDALRAAKDGRAGEAVRFAYRAAILQLADLGVWRIDEARTAREYVTLLPRADPRGGAFREIAGQLERVVYAKQSTSADDLARLLDHLEALGCVRPHERAI